MKRLEDENNRLTGEAEAKNAAVDKERDITFKNQQDEIRDLKRQVENLKKIESELKASYENMQADLSNEIETLKRQLEAESQMKEEAQRLTVTIEERADARCS